MEFHIRVRSSSCWFAASCLIRDRRETRDTIFCNGAPPIRQMVVGKT